MATPLNIEQVLDARRPAYSRGHRLRYVPGRGFERANTFSRAPGPWWIPVQGVPGKHELWYHDPGCDCRYHRPEAERERPQELKKAA